MSPSHQLQPSPAVSRRQALGAVLAVTGLFIGTAARAAQPLINTLRNSSLFSNRTDTAINGYDTVAYFTVNKPVKGLDSLTHEWKGAKWKFATAENLALFKADPERYAPQYGGYCAYGVAQDNLVKVDPDMFTVRDNKLYLNYDSDVQAKWQKDVPGYIRSADQKFPQLLQK